MKIQLVQSILLQAMYLIPFYLGNKLGQLFRLLQGGDVLDRLIAVFANLGIIRQQPMLSFHIQDLLVGLLFAGAIKLVVVLRGQNRKKFRKGTEYGSARWGAYYQL